jgi:poly-gamma-glutamate capsule biosynthesis protein CapA/YwtB (metallophosphatase superfamily)
MYRRALTEIRDSVDYVVVLPHWGVARQQALCDYQPITAHALIDAGADIVAGAHSHLLQTVEVYNGKPILYGLSQLYLAIDHPAVRTMSLDTVVARVTLGGATVSGVELLPVVLASQDDDVAGEPWLAQADEASRILDTLDAVSQPGLIQRLGDRGWVPLA